MSFRSRARSAYVNTKAIAQGVASSLRRSAYKRRPPGGIFVKKIMGIPLWLLLAGGAAYFFRSKWLHFFTKKTAE